MEVPELWQNHTKVRRSRLVSGPEEGSHRHACTGDSLLADPSLVSSANPSVGAGVELPKIAARAVAAGPRWALL
jgi:hypothetical protein